MVGMAPKQAINECLNCRNMWQDRPGLMAQHYNGCPRCGWRYWLWRNWAKEWRK